ncbi:unnamed protein product, partial [Mesorhabditis belari]|uniref:Uncharacterized protein n=1 Tax=Mesorhabditis belari TaxID=2138241 RepID=A0AAF3EV27_9BILA
MSTEGNRREILVQDERSIVCKRCSQRVKRRNCLVDDGQKEKENRSIDSTNSSSTIYDTARSSSIRMAVKATSDGELKTTRVNSSSQSEATSLAGAKYTQNTHKTEVAISSESRLNSMPNPSVYTNDVEVLPGPMVIQRINRPSHSTS